MMDALEFTLNWSAKASWCDVTTSFSRHILLCNNDLKNKVQGTPLIKCQNNSFPCKVRRCFCLWYLENRVSGLRFLSGAWVCLRIYFIFYELAPCRSSTKLLRINCIRINSLSEQASGHKRKQLLPISPGFEPRVLTDTCHEIDAIPGQRLPSRECDHQTSRRHVIWRHSPLYPHLYIVKVQICFMKQNQLKMLGQVDRHGRQINTDLQRDGLDLFENTISTCAWGD